jgi:hypothetical protein
MEKDLLSESNSYLKSVISHNDKAKTKIMDKLDKNN